MRSTRGARSHYPAGTWPSPCATRAAFRAAPAAGETGEAFPPALLRGEHGSRAFGAGRTVSLGFAWVGFAGAKLCALIRRCSSNCIERIAACSSASETAAKFAGYPVGATGGSEHGVCVQSLGVSGLDGGSTVVCDSTVSSEHFFWTAAFKDASLASAGSSEP